MAIELKYGQGTISIELPESADVDILKPNPVRPVSSTKQALTNAFKNLDENNADLLPELRQKETVAIAIPDETRPLPVIKVLPIILDWLFTKIPDLIPERVTILVGGGLHPPVDKETLERLVPPKVVQGCRVLAHDAINSQMVDYGTTGSGNPSTCEQCLCDCRL